MARGTKFSRTLTYVKNTTELNEYIKCAKNPVYFIMSHLKITHPMWGKIPFMMYPFQVALLLKYLLHKYIVTLKPRQMGISTLVAAYALWLVIFHPHKSVLIVSIKQSTARALLRRVKLMYREMPDYLKVETVNGTAQSIGTADRIEFANGSEISVSGSTDDSGRSDSLALLIMDEAAFQRHASTTWGAAQQTLATGGQAIILSTAFGVGNFFHTTYTGALTGNNGFYPIRLVWWMHPDRDKKWHEEQARVLGPKRLAQEIDCNFLQSGYNVFDLAKIRAIEDRILENPAIFVKEYNEGAYKQYFKPVKGMDYVLGADIASGRSRDYSSFSIMDMYGKEYANFKGKVGIRDFSHLMMQKGMEYNYAWLAPEVNAIGEGIVAHIQAEGYENLYHHVNKTLRMDEFEHDKSIVAGWLTTGKTRHEIITGIDDDLNDDLIELYSDFFVNEAYTFIYNEANKPIALGKDKNRGGVKSSEMYEDDTALSYSDDNIIATSITNEVRKRPDILRVFAPMSAGV